MLDRLVGSRLRWAGGAEHPTGLSAPGFLRGDCERRERAGSSLRIRLDLFEQTHLGLCLDVCVQLHL